MSRQMEICMKHKILGWLPFDRFHFHMVKPMEKITSDDYKMIFGINLRWWKVNYGVVEVTDE